MHGLLLMSFLCFVVCDLGLELSLKFWECYIPGGPSLAGQCLLINSLFYCRNGNVYMSLRAFLFPFFLPIDFRET